MISEFIFKFISYVFLIIKQVERLANEDDVGMRPGCSSTPLA